MVQMRSSELADSPVQRNSALRGLPLVVDLRATGVDDGRAWVGTPLGDLTGYLAIIERDIAQLTARGGTVSLSAGDSIVMHSGAAIDVSGGLLTHGAGYVRTSMLSLGGRATPISSARADIDYDGVYTGTTTVTSKWRAPQTYSSGIFNPANGYNQNSYFEGAPAGTLQLKAPSILAAGKLSGHTYISPDQQQSPPALGTLRLAFLGERQLGNAFLDFSPSAPEVRIVAGRTPALSLPQFELFGSEPQRLPDALRGAVVFGSSLFDEDEDGFGNLAVENPDGDFVVAATQPIRLRPGGKLEVAARNVRVDGGITVPGGSVSLTAYNFSPLDLATLDLESAPAPAVQPGRGLLALGPAASLDVAGMMVDERSFSRGIAYDGQLIHGGSIRLEAYSVRLSPGSVRAEASAPISRIILPPAMVDRSRS